MNFAWMPKGQKIRDQRAKRVKFYKERKLKGQRRSKGGGKQEPGKRKGNKKANDSRIQGNSESWAHRGHSRVP